MSFTDLPLVYELIHPDSTYCKTSSSSTRCTCEHGTQKQPFTHDKRLQQWKKWMQRRRLMNLKLGQLLQRNPGELVMNTCEAIHRTNEDKLLLEYAKIPVPDPQRGCPGFWELPFALNDDPPKYFAAVRKRDNCEVPEMEVVGIPSKVLEEKDVLPRTRDSHARWSKSSYLQEKNTEMLYRIKKIMPHKPIIEDLIVIGNPKNELSNIQDTQIIEDKSEEEASVEIESKTLLNLFINGLHLAPNLQLSGTRKVYLFFDYDTESRKVAKQFLTLANSGTVTIRFYWKEFKEVQLFKDILPPNVDEAIFNFNKNEGLIIPGQTIKLPIWFKTSNPGTYREQWQFCTKPQILSESGKLLISMHASAFVGNIDDKINSIREQLDCSIRDRLIKECLSGVLSNVSYYKFKPTVYTYNKKDIFEAVNSQFDPVDNQGKYCYDKEIVRELQKFYKTVRRPTDPKSWNYHLEELKILTRIKQKNNVYLKYQNENKAIKTIIEEKSTSAKLICEKPTSPNQKEHKTADLIRNEHNSSEKPPVKTLTLNEELEMIILKLKRPDIRINLEKNKFTHAYIILCVCFDHIGRVLEELKNNLGIVIHTRYPSSFKLCNVQQPRRLIYEQHYEVLQGIPLLAISDTRFDKVPAEILRDIPIEDSKKRYQTYYNLADPSLEEGKGKKKKGGKATKTDSEKKDKGKSQKKEGKKNAKKEPKETKTADSDEEPDDGYVINELFDPYVHVEFPPSTEVINTIEEDIKIESNLSDLPEGIFRQYKYNMYVIVYNYLNQAIMSIVDMLEAQPERPNRAIIKECDEVNYKKRLIDLKSLVIEESDQQTKAKLILHQYRKYSKKDWKTFEIQRQIRNVNSDSSLWSALRPFDAKPKLPESKPISYPIDHYDLIVKRKGMDNQTEMEMEQSRLKLNVSTSTLEGGVLDTAWGVFSDSAQQKDYENQDPDDLDACIEKLVSSVLLRDLTDVTFDKAVQKGSDEYVSDEEYFYNSDSDSDCQPTNALISSGIDSEQSICHPKRIERK